MGVLIVMIGVLSVLAAAADRRALGVGPWAVPQDLAVGLVFVAAAVVASGSDLERALMALVGVTWLAASLTPVAFLLHQGVLVVALSAFPSGRPTGVARYLLLAASALVAIQALPQWGVALVFVAVALITSITSRPRPAGVYPAVASMSVAAALAFAWSDLRSASPRAGPYAYEGVLVAVAVGYPLALRALVRGRRRLADSVLGDVPDGMQGLAVLLRRALADDTLTVTVGDAGGLPLSSGLAVPASVGQVLHVAEGGQVLATVSATSGVLDDEPTARAVLATVRLFRRNQQLQDQQRQRILIVQATRARLLAAADRERGRTSSRLAREVGEPLGRAADALAAVDQEEAAEVAELLALVRSELAGATADVQRLVAGSAPVSLGRGRLVAALADLAVRAPGQVHLRCHDGAEADAVAETALFYVCSEAVANAAKHAAGSPVSIDLDRSGDSLVLTVRDEGPGGADLAGSGLVGLVDRVAAAGGLLDVHSPAGAGTTVVARVPVTVAGRTGAPRAGRGLDDVPPLSAPGRRSPTWSGRRPAGP